MWSIGVFWLIPAMFGSGVDTALVGRDLGSLSSFDERLCLCFRSDFFDFFCGIGWVSSSFVFSDL